MLSALSTMVGTALLEAFTSPCSKMISFGTAAEIAPPLVRAGSSSDIAPAGRKRQPFVFLPRQQHW